MKVLHILTQSLPFIAGNTIRTSYIVKFQKYMGITPLVLTSPIQGDFSVEKEEIDGITHFRTDYPLKWLIKPFLRFSPVRHFFSIIALTLKAREIINSELVSIIHAHSPATCGLAGYAAARLTGVPFMSEMRGFWHLSGAIINKYSEHSIGYRIREWAEKWVATHSEHVVAIGTNLRKELERMGVDGSLITIVPNGVDPLKFTREATDDVHVEEIRNKYQLQDNTVLGYIGSSFHYEGIEFLVDAFGSIAKKITDIKLMIVGKMDSDMFTDSFNPDISKRIIFTGAVPHSEVPDYYETMDIMCYPRMSSPLTRIVTALKPLEAMAARKAVIASDLEAFREYIEEDVTGVLFPAGAKDDFIKKAVELIQDPDKRKILGEKAYRFVCKEHEWKKLIEMYIPVYNSLAKK